MIFNSQPSISGSHVLLQKKNQNYLRMYLNAQNAVCPVCKCSFFLQVKRIALIAVLKTSSRQNKSINPDLRRASDGESSC